MFGEIDERFKLLKKAYIDARYKKDYKITKTQLEYLAKCVKTATPYQKNMQGED